MLHAVIELSLHAALRFDENQKIKMKNASVLSEKFSAFNTKTTKMQLRLENIFSEAGQEPAH